ncbi:hypothetical protein DPEC_G00352290 [Dallia pectoralis]|uniref:Uncharacterized protein n=1 Tax=Dallia pectoralis TaxID=75939 RepID=A0ACC2F224_DALPE|nr:hypothetical protein DPEC_G00352290 [Dallia pectoralis]
MNSSHRRGTFSIFPNQEDALAVENAVRTAIHTVVTVISRINSARIQDYQRRFAEKDRENETLKRRVKKAEREISALRGSIEISGNECHQVRTSNYAPSPEMPTGEANCHKDEVTSEADWRSDFPSMDAPPHVSSQYQNTTHPTGAAIDMAHRQNQTFHVELQSGCSAVRSNGQSPSPRPVTGPIIKEEPTDMDTFFIKWEMSEENIGVEQEDLDPVQILEKDREAHQGVGAPADRTHFVAGSLSRHEYGDGPTRHLKRRLSSAETQRRFRERLRADPEKYMVYKEKERRRNQQRKVSISDLPEETRRLKREAWREASRRCRARKMSSLQMNHTQPCLLPPETTAGHGLCHGGWQ